MERQMANTEAADRLHRALEASKIPGYMHHALVSYITEGKPTGGFLNAVLCNDLKGACNKADEANQVALYDYVFFLFNDAPVACWGSPERVARWMEIQGKVESL